MNVLRSARPGHAELRVRRLLAFTVGISAATNLATDFAVYRQQFAEFASWWSYPAVAGQVLGVLALLVVPWISRGSALRVVCIAFGAFGLVSIALIVPAAGAGGLPDELGAPWPLRVQSTYAMPLMIAVWARFGWGYVAVLSGFSFLARYLTSETTNARQAIEDSVVNTTVSVLLAILVILLVRTGRALDQSAELAIAAVRRDSAEEARAIERRRVELLAHDEILHVLRVVGMGVRTSTVTPARLAVATLERLERLESLDPEADGDLDAHDLAADEFLARMRGLVTAIAPLATFDADELDDVVVPGTTAVALLDASGEALRNSMAHAGDRETGVSRTVRVSRRDGILSVSIVDDGRGFRPREVSARRLGVARSIVERMRAVPGGGATIDSSPGAGTTVELTWR